MVSNSVRRHDRRGHTLAPPRACISTPTVDRATTVRQVLRHGHRFLRGQPANSNAAHLTVTAGNVSPTIITQPVGQSVAAGSTPSFSVVATGSPTLTYQWYLIPAGQTTATANPGATSATYTLPARRPPSSNDQDSLLRHRFQQLRTSSLPARDPRCGQRHSSANHQVNPLPQYVDVGAPATYQVTATSSLPLTYQWYVAAPGSSTFTLIPVLPAPPTHWIPRRIGLRLRFLRGCEQRDYLVGHQHFRGAFRRTLGRRRQSLQYHLVGARAMPWLKPGAASS